ncbi:MAG: iron-containing alcohol dehydrogenase [Spirochaetales bacterium]|nr:iron-containing alcohol dehydrogenase [Spirochaetales bacterium]
MIKQFDFHVPVKLVFGEGRHKELGPLVRQYGKKALIVTTGPLFKETGLVQRLQGILKENGVDSLHFGDVSPNPLSTQVDAGAAVAKKEGVDVFIGLGGGSAIDAAKGMAISVGHNRPIWDFCIGEKVAEITEKTLPIIAVTTTSGTGSEGTQWAVITNPKTKEKPGIGNEYTFAKVAMVDPELMESMPPRITASTGFDTFAHAMEAYTSRIATPITDMYCETAIRLVGRYLRRVVRDGNDREARNGMALANTLAGFSIAVAVVTTCHALGHVVGGICGTTHGETLAVMTPHTMRFSMRYNIEKYRRIGMLLRDECTCPEKDALEDGVREVETLIRDIGLKTHLAELGVKKEELKAIADGVYSYMNFNIDIDPRFPSKEELLNLLELSY